MEIEKCRLLLIPQKAACTLFIRLSETLRLQKIRHFFGKLQIALRIRMHRVRLQILVAQNIRPRHTAGCAAAVFVA